MTETIKVPALSRELEVGDFVCRKEEAGPYKLSFSASSERPVERWFGKEILSHDPKAIRMERMKGGAMPLLFNHNMDDPIGMIDTGRAEKGRLIVDAHLFDTARAKEVQAMVEGGLRNVSIGYRLNVVEENKSSDTFTATDWEPFEVSIVTVPADPSVGLGRSHEFEVRMFRASPDVKTPAKPAAITGAIMAEENAAAGTSADVRIEIPNGPSALEFEQSRVRGIENLCKANGIDDGIKSRWVSGGSSIEGVTEDLLKILKARGAASKTVAHVGLSDQETRKYSLARAIRACADQNWNGAGFEAEVSQEIGKRMGRVSDKMKFYVPAEVQHRDMTVASAGNGGYLVGTNNQSFIELLRNASVAYKMGVTNLSGLVGNVTVPRQTAAGTNYWLSTEATAITESQQTLTQMSLSPKTAGAYTEISRQLLLQSSPSVESLVQSDLAQTVALAVDLAVLSGSGASGQPTGITQTAGIGSVTGTAITYAAGIMEFLTDTASGNALFDSSGFVTTPTVAGLLKGRVKFTSTASPIWEGKLLEGSIDGYKAMASNQVSAGNLLFGDFSKVVLAEWGVLEVEVNPYANFAAGIVGVRAMYSIDVGVRYAAAFSLAATVT